MLCSNPHWVFEQVRELVEDEAQREFLGTLCLSYGRTDVAETPVFRTSLI